MTAYYPPLFGVLCRGGGPVRGGSGLRVLYGRAGVAGLGGCIGPLSLMLRWGLLVCWVVPGGWCVLGVGAPDQCMEGCVVLLWGELQLGLAPSFLLGWHECWWFCISGGGVWPLCCVCCGLFLPPFCLLGWCLFLGHGGGRGRASLGLLDCLAAPGGLGPIVCASFTRWMCLCLRPLLELCERGCLLRSAVELAPWESILPCSPSLLITGHLPPPTPSHYHSYRALGCRCVIGVLQGISIIAVPWQPVPQFYCTT
ncbi:hypothetical protein ILYODFUR_030015 [Ilyodon furcidens]|uniref:Uncharacterized protein n=1 Tax=Ilyodon furcidens TaxID=33524 RepID=A0ABV0TC72_9TELE